MSEESTKPSGIALAKPEKGSEDFVKIDPMKIKVLDCRVLCQLVDWGNVTAGGLVLPETHKDSRALTIMKVVKVGSGRTTDHGVHIPVRVKEGDYVIVGQYAGHEIKGPPGGPKFKILNEVEIFGVQEVEEEE
jgi:co-chaperonin GroES (HSP10)